MTYGSRPIVIALVAAIILFFALSKETWVAIPIVAGIGVVLLSRSHHLGRGPTVAALVLIASITFVVFGTVITLLARFAREMAGLVFASGLTAIALGLVGMILSVIQIRRALRPDAPDVAAPNEPVGPR